MAAQLLFYSDVVPVSSEHHRETSVRAGADYGFASFVNSVPLTATEFTAAALHYPIVFAGNEETVMPSVILGMRDGENLWVDDEGQWTEGYVPAFVRRYPFVFSTSEDGKTFYLSIDESFDGVNTEGRGERMFDSDGQHTQYVKQIMAFMEAYQAQFQRTQFLCKRLLDLKLLKPTEAHFALPGGEKHTLHGFFAVDREALKALDAKIVVEMFSTDELECIFLHLQSLRHFMNMPGLISAPAAADPEAAEPEVAPA